MQTISYVTYQQDAYVVIDWFYPALTEEQCDTLANSGEYKEYYEMSFPDEFSIEGWAGINSIYLWKFEEYAKDYGLDLED